MNVYRIYIFIVDLTFSPLLMIDKKERKILSLYMHICVFAYIEFMHLIFFLQNGENVFKSLNKKGEKVLEKGVWIYAFASHLIDAYMFV